MVLYEDSGDDDVNESEDGAAEEETEVAADFADEAGGVADLEINEGHPKSS